VNLVALQKEIDRMGTELRLSGELTDSRLMELKADIDRLKLEIAALNRFLEQALPSFAQVYPDMKEKIFREVNPEMD
jgi:hypothetical protein